MCTDIPKNQLAVANNQKIFFTGKEAELKLGCEIVRKEFHKLYFNEKTLENSCFRDSYFKDVTFSKANLNYTDFENIIFENCNFENCRFGSDVRSCIFLDSTFINTKIDESYIDGCTFKNSVIKNSSIDITSITNCIFESCLLENIYLKTASLYHNIFKKCEWIDLDYSFVTIFYIVLANCQFRDVTLALPTLDYIFGFKEENFKNIYLKKFHRKKGKSLKFPLSAWKDYENMRSKSLSILTKGFCLRENSIIQILESFFLSIPKKKNSCPYISREDILFLQNILSSLEADGNLPIFALILVIDWTIKTINLINLKGDNTDIYYIQPTLIQLYTRFYQLFQNKLYLFENQRIFFEKYSEDQELVASFIFHVKPKLSVSKLLNELSEISGMKISSKTQFISSKEGSYVEIVKTTFFTLFAIQIFLYLLNDIVIKLTELKARFKVLKRKRLPKHFYEMSITDKHIVSSSLKKILKNFFEKSYGLDILKDIDFLGYNSENIENIDILSCIEKNNGEKNKEVSS